MEVYHLSHTDLDGYGAQFVTRHFFEDIEFFNSNYGREVMANLEAILARVKSFSDKSLILITDLNLSLKEAKFLHSEVKSLENCEVLLLDHHISGQECANVYAWYKLDSSICASKITLQYMLANYAFKGDSSKKERLIKFIDMIDSADTWKEDGFGFDFGKVALGMIAQSREFSRYMFDDFDREFKFKMLEKAQEILLDSSNNLRENANVLLDNAIFFFKKEILGGDKDSQTMEQILSQKQSALLAQNKDEYSIYIDGFKGILTYGIGNISVVANLFLREHSEFAFFMNVANGGNISLRSNDVCDVSALSKKYFDGGGHKNASGGKIEGFKYAFRYQDAKAQVVNRYGDDDDDDFAL